MDAPLYEEQSASAMPEWYDPFIVPQDYPTGWDLSEMVDEKNTVR